MNDLDKIKEILFGNEKKALNALLRRLETPESRTADVADVLPDAVTRSFNRDPRLGKALSQPVESTLSNAIRREPKKFADALFPIMGPAIRKAISEALKSMLQSMNNAIDTSLSPSARFKAWRAGVPLAEWVLRENLVYRVDEIYLVDPETGLLINHLHHPNVIVKDEDAVSAMLTAIQDFVRDSFAKGGGGGLDSAVIGDYTVWISHGPHAMLACVIRGVPPTDLKPEIAAINERIHLRHSQALLEFQGTPGSIEGLDMDLEELLRLEHKKKEESKKRSLLPLPLMLVLFGLIAVLGYFLISGWRTEQRMEEFDALLRGSDGLVTTQLMRDGRQIVVNGLRDPLASDPIELARQAGIKADKLTSDFRPFQSLDPSIVELRARRILSAPEGVSMRMENNTLIVNGNASESWRNKLTTMAPAIGGIEHLDIGGLREDDESLKRMLIRLLSPPPGVDISVTQGVAIFSGVASSQWHKNLEQIGSNAPGIVDINVQNLAVEEIEKLKEIHASLNNRQLFFQSGTQLAEGQDVELVYTANLIRQYSDVMARVGRQDAIEVIGFADGIGSVDNNQVMMVRRANYYRDRLINLGVDPRVLHVDTAPVVTATSIDPNLRKAELRLPKID